MSTTSSRGLGKRRRIFHAMKLINYPPRGRAIESDGQKPRLPRPRLQLLWDAGILGQNSIWAQELSPGIATQVLTQAARWFTLELCRGRTSPIT
jgi:hypothetical protein